MHGKEEVFEGKWYQHPPMKNALIAGVITLLSFGLAHLGLIPDFVEITLFVVAILVGGYHWTSEGIEEFIQEKEIGIEILMIAATLGSAILGLWDEAAFLVVIFGVAEGLEEYAYARTRASIRKLLDLAPKEARLLKNGKEVIVLATELKVGDIFLIKPGESIATDGEIVEGRSSINEAAVTGESIPAEKKKGMKVFAGSMNQEGAIQVQATATFEDNTLSKMIHLVEEAQEQKGATQTLVERFGKRYSPLVLLTAFLFVVFPPIFGASMSVWSTRAVVLLVAAAPCALVMSTPVAIAAAISKAGLNGVLIKGGAHLDNLGKIKVVALDKTGTLTRGRPIVTDVVALNGKESRVLDLAYSVDKYSEHPLAQSIIRKAEEVGANLIPVEDFRSVAGYGAQAKIGKDIVYVGKQGLFKNFASIEPTRPEILSLREQGKTVTLVGTENQIEGLIAIRDELRPESKECIRQLHQMGVGVVMLTGDNELTAKAFASELGIDDYRADLKPEAKVDAIKQLKEKYGEVAMVGDGINDSPALAQATVGIAMGTAGADAAIEAADVALMADDLRKVVFAIKLGKRSGRISFQNIVFSILILATLIPSAVAGVLGVAAAVATHEISELLAVANGLRVGGRID